MKTQIQRQIHIQEPFRRPRTITLEKEIWLGSSSAAGVPLKDTTLPEFALLIRPLESGKIWIQVPEGAPEIQVGDLSVRNAEWPIGYRLRLGETEIRIEAETTSEHLPEIPSGVLPWLTVSDEGRKTLWTARKSARTSLSIYLEGETGTGKEVLAHLIHAWSERATGPFIPLHCGALPLSLAESELFGHTKGSFTGAHKQRPGALMQAHNGTLFLDEVGDLSPEIQVKLLRFLENGEIRPVGADQCFHASARVVCATHLPLEKLVEQGKFRQDLYYRLASVNVQIPPLRTRPEDIALLATKFAKETGHTISPQALRRLQSTEWRGNVRELRHAIERACGLVSESQSELKEEQFAFLLENTGTALSLESAHPSGLLSLKEMERVMLLKTLRLTQGNRNSAAKILGVARSTLFDMLKRHRIPGPRTSKQPGTQGKLFVA